MGLHSSGNAQKTAFQHSSTCYLHNMFFSLHATHPRCKTKQNNGTAHLYIIILYYHNIQKNAEFYAYAPYCTILAFLSLLCFCKYSTHRFDPVVIFNSLGQSMIPGQIDDIRGMWQMLLCDVVHSAILLWAPTTARYNLCLRPPADFLLLLSWTKRKSRPARDDNGTHVLLQEHAL